MNKKISLGMCISLIIISITATFAITMVVSKQIYSSIISNISQRSENHEAVEEISRIISSHYFGSVDDTANMNASLAEGYVNGLDVGINRYLTAAEYADYNAKLEGGVKGIGVETFFKAQTNQLIVTHVYENSPAEKAGLQKNDIITAINNETVHITNYSVLEQMLYGSMLSSVQVEYERNGETKVVEPMLGFSIPGVIARLEGNVGYVKINGFYKNTASEFKEAVEKLIDEGATAVVFDVRNTDDGSIKYAAQVIDVIVPTGTIATAKGKDGSTYKGNAVFTSENSSISGVNFAVLINKKTAGPAELFACIMRDVARAQLVGSDTAGIGTMQELFTLEDGGAVLLTVALIEPVGGEATIYNDIGLKPTIPVDLSVEDTANLEILTPAQDAQLAAALNMLAGY